MNEKGFYRPLYTALWDDRDWKELPPNAKLVFVCLRTCRLTNMACISIFGDGETLTISQMTGLSTEDVKTSLQKLSDTHWIAYREGILWIRNGLKHDPTVSLKNAKHVKGVELIVKSLPKEQVVLDFCDHYKIAYPFDSLSIPLRIPFHNESESESDTEIEMRETRTSQKPTPVAPPLDQLQKREMDWLLKAIRLMAGTSRTFQADLMSNGDLEVKFTKWSRESGGLRWIIFCVGIMWRRVEVYNDGLNDPFACAKPKAIDSPMSYLHSLVFPEKNGHQANFMAGEAAYREEVRTETWYKIFFKKLDTSL